MIIAIGSQRIAFDFKTQITELDPKTGDRPATIKSFCKHKQKPNKPTGR